MTWIQTYTGKKITPLDPKVEDVCIKDIAHALALKTRFSGHCREFYSVAQHSVLVSSHLPACHAMQGLMHDAAEAYLPDFASPIKRSFLVRTEAATVYEFAAVESQVLGTIAEALGFQLPLARPVLEMDRVLLATEKRDLMAASPDEWGPLPDPLESTIGAWNWEAAEKAFLARWDQLTSQLSLPRQLNRTSS